MNQPGVGDGGAVERQRSVCPRPFQVRQTSVGDARTRKREKTQHGESVQAFQTGIGNASSIEAEIGQIWESLNAPQVVVLERRASFFEGGELRELPKVRGSRSADHRLV